MYCLFCQHFHHGASRSSSVAVRRIRSSVHPILFTSEEGKHCFAESLAEGKMESYFRLAGQYHAQRGDGGIAVLCMVLNSLSIDPARIWKSPWRWYSEELLDCCVPLSKVRETGLNFTYFGKLASCNGAQVEPFRFSERNEHQFRQDVRRVASMEDQCIVIYDQGALGMTGGGHFIPIGGYNSERDTILLLDIGPERHSPIWVPTKTLFTALLQSNAPQLNNKEPTYQLLYQQNCKQQLLNEGSVSTEEAGYSKSGYFIISKKSIMQAPSICMTTGRSKLVLDNMGKINLSTNSNNQQQPKALDATTE